MGTYVVLLPKCLNNENISIASETSAGQSFYVLGPVQPFSEQSMSHHSESRGLACSSMGGGAKRNFSLKKKINGERILCKQNQVKTKLHYPRWH